MPDSLLHHDGVPYLMDRVQLLEGAVGGSGGPRWTAAKRFRKAAFLKAAAATCWAARHLGTYSTCRAPLSSPSQPRHSHPPQSTLPPPHHHPVNSQGTPPNVCLCSTKSFVHFASAMRLPSSSTKAGSTPRRRLSAQLPAPQPAASKPCRRRLLPHHKPRLRSSVEETSARKSAAGISSNRPCSRHPNQTAVVQPGRGMAGQGGGR